MARIENLMLANHAESVNGLLYVHGGGWTHHWRGADAGEHASQLAVAATVLLEGEAEVPFVVIVRAAGGDEVLRADGMLHGSAGGPGEQVRTGIALNASVIFPGEGAYELTAEIGGQAGPVVGFWVHDRVPDPGSPDTEPGGTAGYL